MYNNIYFVPHILILFKILKMPIISDQPFEIFITILKIQIHTLINIKQFYYKMGSNKLIEQPTAFCVFH